MDSRGRSAFTLTKRTHTCLWDWKPNITFKIASFCFAIWQYKIDFGPWAYFSFVAFFLSLFGKHNCDVFLPTPEQNQFKHRTVNKETETKQIYTRNLNCSVSSRLLARGLKPRKVYTRCWSVSHKYVASSSEILRSASNKGPMHCVRTFWVKLPS